MIKITFDNGEEYTEEKFKKDKTRMFDFIRIKNQNISVNAIAVIANAVNVHLMMEMFA